LIEKILGHRAQIKKCKEYFARRRASASGGGAVSSAQSRFGFCHIIPPSEAKSGRRCTALKVIVR
ncbi:MAG TPA: hypothetical protein VNM40_00935, partial [Candidatus Paceibacterota bacterium]|nr:hypothetical protein [Candidatus Paceibacterota bacterium]